MSLRLSSTTRTEPIVPYTTCFRVGVAGELAWMGDKAAAGRGEGEARLAAARGTHVGHLALALGHLLDDRARMLVVDVDDDRLVGLLAAIGAVAEEDAGAADRQLEALSAHRLDKDAQLKLAAAGDLEAVIIVRGGEIGRAHV